MNLKIEYAEVFNEKQLKDINFFYENVDKYLNDPFLTDKYIIISEEKLINSFDNFENAIKYAVEKLPKNEFIIQHVTDNKKIVNFI